MIKINKNPSSTVLKSVVPANVEPILIRPAFRKIKIHIGQQFLGYISDVFNLILLCLTKFFNLFFYQFHCIENILWAFQYSHPEFLFQASLVLFFPSISRQCLAQKIYTVNLFLFMPLVQNQIGKQRNYVSEIISSYQNQWTESRYIFPYLLLVYYT